MKQVTEIQKTRIDKEREAKIAANSITIEKLKKFVPKNMLHMVTDEVVDIIKNSQAQCGIDVEDFEEQLLSHSGLMGKIGQSHDIEYFLNALKYCILCDTMPNVKAFEVVFPAKTKKIHDDLAAGITKTPYDVHVSRYNNRQLMKDIRAQRAVHTSIKFAHYNEWAIQKSYELANGISATGKAVSPTVEMLAAKNLYDMTKAPDEIESKQIQLEVGYSDKMMEQYQKMNDNMASIIANQKAAFGSGGNIADAQKIHYKKEKADIEEIQDADVLEIDDDEYYNT
jgi:hypothetical protein